MPGSSTGTAPFTLSGTNTWVVGRGPAWVVDPGPALPPTPPEQVLLAEAERSRPEVAQAQTAVEVARLEVAKQRGFALPVVTGEGGWAVQKSPVPTDEYGVLTLRVNVPVYQGGEVGARVATARERQRMAAPEPGTSACDDGDAAIKTKFHANLPRTTQFCCAWL